MKRYVIKTKTFIKGKPRKFTKAEKKAMVAALIENHNKFMRGEV